jgi:flagellar basal-body rod modification protein FlgD
MILVNINNANALGLGATGAAATGTTATSHAKKNADINTFMTLLVAQLRNQDPLAPQEGAEFVAQLAQFNSLEQLININDRLSQLVNQQKTQPTT